MPLIRQKKGDKVTYSEFEKVLINLEVYKFKVLKNFTLTDSGTWSIDMKTHFNIPVANQYDYEYGGIMVPYRSVQTSTWRTQYNNWWTTQNISSNGIGTFNFNKQGAGGWAAPVNQKWFSIVLWCKPITQTAKVRELPAELFDEDHRGDIVTWLSILNAQKSTVSDTIKNVRFVPYRNGFTNIKFTRFFNNFDIDIHKIGVIPSIQSMYTVETYGAEASGSLSVDDDQQYLDVDHNYLSGGREIEFLMFKGIR